MSLDQDVAAARRAVDALEQALHARRPIAGGLVHHSDRGVQYVSITYTDRLVDAGIVPSVGSVGDAYDNALMESINGLYKAECIRSSIFHDGPYKTLADVEYATAAWVEWFGQ